MALNLVRHALLPASSLYGAAAAVRRRAYRRGWLASQGVGVPVVSVGGLSIGGSGKTPIAGQIAAWLGERVARVGVVCGGYRGKAGDRVLRVPPAMNSSAAWYGDEPVMLARKIPEAIVVRGPDKVAGAVLAARLGARVVVVDDGFQHLKLRRALDVVVCGPGDGLPLPAGPGREWASAIRHADLVWWHDRSGGSCSDGAVADRAQDMLRVWPAGLPADIVSRYEVDGLLDGYGRPLGTTETLRGSSVCLIASVARPQALVELVAAQGAEVVESFFLRDHSRFRARQLRHAAATTADRVVCTEKDLARCGEALRLHLGKRLAVLACRVCVCHGQGVLEQHLHRALKET